MKTSIETSLQLNIPVVEKLLVKFIHDETQNAGFQRVILGLSGGIDSAVTAALAVKALGKDNVCGIIMPHKISTPISITDAELVARYLGIRTEIVEITPMVDSYISAFNVLDKVRRGNIMARVRMIILYDISARDKALVLGTSNKTELLLGYGTIYGDLAFAINPIGDLYKTQVWQLAEALDIPKSIIYKVPSADLWVGQTDEDELGFEYRQVDRLLYAMINENRKTEELMGMGFNKSFIEKVQEMIRRNQFKRELPKIAKILV